MTEWGTYRLQDFVPFTAEVYFRLLERMGEAYWPLHLLMLALGAAALGLALAGRVRMACLLLAPAWAFVGVAYFIQRYAQLNWAGAYIGWAFIAEAAFLALLAISSLGVESSTRRQTLPTVTGVVLATLGLIGWPLIAPLLGQPWLQGETFGMHPTPTALVTLGLLPIALRGAAMWLAAGLPLIWVSLAGLTLLVLEAPWATASFAVLAIGLAALALKSAARETTS